MPVLKQADGQWIADLSTVDRSNGNEGKRSPKRFLSKGEALAFETYTLHKIEDAAWLGDDKDKWRLSDLVHLWFAPHGITLRDGEKRKSAVLWAAECMGTPLVIGRTLSCLLHIEPKGLRDNFLEPNTLTTYRPEP